MKPIRAIVLTYDKYRSLTDHMILCYDKIWPRNPFYFQIPYQELSPTVKTDRVQYRKCPPDIKGTVLTMLSDLGDEEMVFWCPDDKYPIKLNIPRLEKIHQWLLASHEETTTSGLLFCRVRGMLKQKNLVGKELLDDQGNVYLERRNYEQIWIPQYAKVKVIRYLFASFPDEIPTAKVMDDLKSHVRKPKSHRLFVTSENLAVFGESTSRGVLTKNCFESMRKNNVPIPPWASETTGREQIIGDKNFIGNQEMFFGG